MGIYDRQYYRDDDDESYGEAVRPSPWPMVYILIAVNVAVFVADFLFFYKPRDLDTSLGWIIGTRPTTLTQPWLWWQFLTYGFAHAPESPWHVFWNMFGLWMFGRPVEGIYGRRLFLQIYLTAVLLGGVFWSIKEYVLLSPEGYAPFLIGASGAVTAVVFLYILHFPRETILFMFFLPMQAWVFGVIFIGLNVLGTRVATLDGTEGGIAFDVHLVGAAYAYLFFRTRWDLLSIFRLDRLAAAARRIFSGRPAFRVHRPAEGPTLAEEADRVLAKLHREGEASLTADERKTLEDYSRRIRGRRG
jgi:membrane associated rhomboid family serine protease